MIGRIWPLVLRAWPIAAALRVVVVVVLAFGPATDEPAELAGWDAERFQEIAERSEPAWSGQPVEYPPGSVVILDRLAGADVVGTHRRLLLASLGVDLACALALGRRLGPAAAKAFVVLGLPLIPLGYQRLDTLVTALAIAGTLALLAARPGPTRAGPLPADLAAGAAIAAGALTKVWPLVLAVGALAIGRWRAVAVGAALTIIGATAWLATAGAGVEPIDQVLSLRGATGWHVESLPGSLVALVGSADARLELNAYRIGSLRPGLVTAGRMAAVAIMGLLAWAGMASTRRSAPYGGPSTRVLGLTLLGSTAALLATAPLLSPQFLVWTTPWVVLAIDDRLNGRSQASGPIRGPLAAIGAAVLTGVTLTAFGPAGLASTVPAFLLTVRNLLLAAVPILCLLDLIGPSRTAMPEQGR